MLILLYSAVSSALHTILLTSLYAYASEDRVPEGYDRAAFVGAFGRA